MKWHREPLIHFLLLGGLLFGLFALVNDEAISKPSNQIEITATDVQRLREVWTKQWNRPPTQAELDGLIESHLREEVLYREALALGIDGNDTIIRRRLAQKMEFLFEDLTLQEEPTNEELKAYFERNRDKYLLPAQVSFSHVYFNVDRRGESAYANAKQLLKKLQSRQPGILRASDQGDRFMLEYEYAGITQREVANVFGLQFAEKLFTTRKGIWQGPIESGYGLHLVRVGDFSDSSFPAFVKVRARVKTDFMAEQRRLANERIYQNLKSRYTIVIAKTTIHPRVAHGIGQEQKGP